jgi:hypothetical protein
VFVYHESTIQFDLTVEILKISQLSATSGRQGEGAASSMMLLCGKRVKAGLRGSAAMIIV